MTTATQRNAAQRLTYRTIDSPVGNITLAGAGITLTRLVIQGQRHQPDRSSWQADNHGFPEAVDQIQAYFHGDLTRFDVEMHLAGTVFQRRVWDVVQLIPYGQTRSYAQIAEQIGAPGASRAVGVAVGRNPIPIIVGCHRVIGSGGGLTGYVGGIGCKRSLLVREISNS